MSDEEEDPVFKLQVQNSCHLTVPRWLDRGRRLLESLVKKLKD